MVSRQLLEELKTRLNPNQKSDSSKLKIMLDKGKQKKQDKNQKLRENYRGHMFDAVGLGVCYLKIKQK